MQYRCPLGKSRWSAKGQYHLTTLGRVTPTTALADLCGKKYRAAAACLSWGSLSKAGLYLLSIPLMSFSPFAVSMSNKFIPRYYAHFMSISIKNVWLALEFFCPIAHFCGCSDVKPSYYYPSTSRFFCVVFIPFL